MYYVPWCLTDAACIACGISYNGIQKSQGQQVETWDKVYCVEVLKVELNTTPVKMMSYWNHSIHVWLKYHV
jgi:hypothetical protein